jgi:hypothetical protein
MVYSITEAMACYLFIEWQPGSIRNLSEIVELWILISDGAPLRTAILRLRNAAAIQIAARSRSVAHCTLTRTSKAGSAIQRASERGKLMILLSIGG